MSHTVNRVYQDGDVYRADVTVENMGNAFLPFISYPSDEDIESAVSKYVQSQEMLSPDCEDIIYSKGAIVRIDTHKSGEPSTGRATGAREPYNENHDSTYYAGEPSPALLDEWKVADKDNLAGWYGIKTIDSGSRFLKVVRYSASWANEPTFPGSIWVYASVFSEDGTESSVKDIYINAEPEEMKQWCVENNLDYPLPLEETKKPWCYGVYWNSNTGVIEGVKGYVRYT